MRYQNLSSFEKHLESAGPNLLCRVYLIISSDAKVRKELIQQVIRAINPDPMDVDHFSGEKENIFDALMSPSLFGNEPVVVIDPVDALKKKQADDLKQVFQKVQFGFLLLGAEKKPNFTKEIEKEGVILDLSLEKPWDKERRLVETLVQMAAKERKKLSFDTAQFLVQRVGSDLSVLEQELFKVSCFVGEREQILPKDIEAMTEEALQQTLWKVAEEIVWEGALREEEIPAHGLIFSVRSQLQMGLKIISLLERRASLSDWSSALPRVFPKTLEKRKAQAHRLGKTYFQKGLEALYKLEVDSRASSTNIESLFDLFQTKLRMYGAR